MNKYVNCLKWGLMLIACSVMAEDLKPYGQYLKPEVQLGTTRAVFDLHYPVSVKVPTKAMLPPGADYEIRSLFVQEARPIRLVSFHFLGGVLRGVGLSGDLPSDYPGRATLFAQCRSKLLEGFVKTVTEKYTITPAVGVSRNIIVESWNGQGTTKALLLESESFANVIVYDSTVLSKQTLFPWLTDVQVVQTE